MLQHIQRAAHGHSAARFCQIVCVGCDSRQSTETRSTVSSTQVCLLSTCCVPSERRKGTEQLRGVMGKGQVTAMPRGSLHRVY